MRTTALVIGAALLYSLALYPVLPDTIPIHWNWRGQPDGWAPKPVGAFLMPGVLVVMAAFLFGLPRLSRSGGAVASFRATYDYITVLCTVTLGYVHVVALQAALHPQFDMTRVLLGGMFLFFAALGNVMGKLRPNPWAGVRTPWTMKSERVWVATHRLAARLMVGASLLGAFAVLVGAPAPLCFLLVIVAIFWPVIYSYLLYKRLESEGEV